MKLNKASGIAIITVIYLVAAAASILLFAAITPAVPELWALLIADVNATVIVWCGGLLWRNVSAYDPYWSVAPPLIFTALAIWKGICPLPVLLLLAAVWYWGVRLTLNWAFTFKGLAHEDWRYTKYRETLSPVLFQLTNFFGLNMMPTLLVFACMVPGLRLYDPWLGANLVTWFGFILCIASATLQLIADRQSHRFRADHPGQVCDAGLWRNGRHPNYFGEIQFWWGIWVMYASLKGFDFLVLAPIAMTALFLFISIPMMERRQLDNKPGYAEYRKRTRLLI